MTLTGKLSSLQEGIDNINLRMTGCVDTQVHLRESIIVTTKDSGEELRETNQRLKSNVGSSQEMKVLRDELDRIRAIIEEERK